jgi:predicted anti-sigma-YlaC factor YlaD
MKCEDIKLLMVEDLYSEISPENKIIFYNHLKSCPNCSAEYADLKKTSETLKLWPDEKSEKIELPQNIIKQRKSKLIFYRIASVAAAILLVLSIINFRFSIDQNGLDISFNLLGLSDGTEHMAANILQNGSQIEQLQLMTELINAANDKQKEEMVVLLTDFYQAIEMRRQADLKVISQGMETLRNTSNQRIEDTENTMQKLIQYTGSILDKGNYIKAVETP